ncbi:MAG: hypothetical protein ACRDGL_04400 [Candidatus Limnocylindrales bacterium]
MDTTFRRRLAVGALWFLTGWVWVGAAVALLALPPLLVPCGALAAGAVAFRLYRGGRGSPVPAPIQTPARTLD